MYISTLRGIAGLRFASDPTFKSERQVQRKLTDWTGLSALIGLFTGLRRAAWLLTQVVHFRFAIHGSVQALHARFELQ